MQGLLGLAVVGATVLSRRGSGGLEGASSLQNRLCYFEIFDGQNPQGRVLMGSPIHCPRKPGSVSNFTAKLRQFKGQQGDPRVVCKFNVLARQGDTALGMARDCRNVR